MASNDQNVFDKIKTNLAIANREKGNASALTVTSAAKKKADAAAAAKAKADTLKAMAAFTAKQKADAAKTKTKASAPAPTGDPQGINKTFADLGDFAGSVGYNFSQPPIGLQAVGNFFDTTASYFGGKTPAPGEGAGDKAVRDMLASANAQYPKQAAAAANAASPAAGLAREAGASNFTQPFTTPKTDSAAPPPPGVNPSGTITPSSIASRMAKPQVVSQREREMNAAMDAGLEYTPGQAAGTAARMAQEAADAKALADSDAQIQSSYNPVLDFLKKQQDQANARYAQNSANLKNIFGALTGIADADIAKINSQFTSSITKQQSDLATRTAEQRAAQSAGAAQAVATGAERGNGPALQGSPTATATEAGIGEANAIQQNWEGLMGAQQANAVTDVKNRGAGYGQQEIAAIDKLMMNRDDDLLGLQGQEAGIQSQIAQAKIARDQAIASGKTEAAQAAQEQLYALQLQDAKNKGAMDVATLKANASIKLKGMGGSGTPKALKGAAGIAQAAEAAGFKLSDVITQYERAYTDAFDALNPGFDPNAPAAKAPKTPTKDQVLKFWSSTIAGSPMTATRMGPLIVDWADTQY